MNSYIPGDPGLLDPVPTGWNGYVPPSTPATSGLIQIPAGVNTLNVTSLNLPFTPQAYLVQVLQDTAADENISTPGPVQGWTSNGFSVNFNDFTPNGNYQLFWQAIPPAVVSPSVPIPPTPPISPFAGSVALPAGATSYTLVNQSWGSTPQYVSQGQLAHNGQGGAPGAISYWYDESTLTSTGVTFYFAAATPDANYILNWDVRI